MTHEELVEKVAREISGAPFPSSRSMAKARDAIAVIYEAMKEPEGGTIQAGAEAIALGVPEGQHLWEANVCFKAMLSASPLNGGTNAGDN